MVSLIRAPSCLWGTRLVLLLLLAQQLAGQGLPVPGKQGLTARDYSRVCTWATDGATWRASYAASPETACSSTEGPCAAGPGTEDYGKLVLATSPIDYDARSASDAFQPIGAVLDQRPCQSSVAFAVISVAEAAAAISLQVNASRISLSQQDLQFCPDAQRKCQDTWNVTAAVERLANGNVVASECLPFTATTADDPAKLCNYSCREQPKLLQGGTFKAAPVRSPLEGQRQIRRHGSFVTRFNIYTDFAEWIQQVAAADPNAVYDCPNSDQPPSQGQAVAVVGYNNTAGYWIVKNSWGTASGDRGFFKVKFGVCGMLAAGDTLGLKFTPAKPSAVPVTEPVTDPRSQAASNSSRLCYKYTAPTGSYISGVADATGIRIGQLLLDNKSTLRDLDKPLSGTQLLLCDPEPTSIAVNSTAQPGSVAATDPAAAPNSAQQRPGAPSQQLAPPTPADAGQETTVNGGSAAGGQAALVGLTAGAAAASPRKGQPTASASADEAAVLSQLQQALKYSNPDWQGTEPCVGPWPNVYCNQRGQVYMIDLSSKGLSGSLSEAVDLSKLPSLQALWLYDNPALTGSLPTTWSQLPQLRDISLYGCSLTGALPQSWGSLKRLRHLYLQGNKLSGPLPAAWSSLSALNNLGLASNALTGNIPSSWSSMRSLKSISLFDNAGLSGCLPSSWLQRPKGSLVRLAKPTDKIRPLAGTQLCRTCSEACKAQRATTAPTGYKPGDSSSSRGGPATAMPAKDPLAGVAGPAVRPADPVPVTVPQGPSPAPSPPSPSPAPSASPSTSPGQSASPLPSAIPPSTPSPMPSSPLPSPQPPSPSPSPPPPPPSPSPSPQAAPTDPKRSGAGTPASGAVPSSPGASAAAAGAPGAAPVQPSGAMERAAVPQQPGPAGPLGPPVPTADPAAAAAAIANGSPPMKTAASSTANGATPAPPPAAQPPATGAISAATPPATPPATPSPPPAQLPNPVGSLPTPVDPSLTVIADNRKNNFQDVASSGSRKLL